MRLFRKKISVSQSFNVIKAPMQIDQAHIEDRYFVEFITTTMYENIFTKGINVSTEHHRDGLAFFSIDEAKTYAENVEKPSKPIFFHYTDTVYKKKTYTDGYIFPKGYNKIYKQLVSAKCDSEILEHFNEMIECTDRRRNCKSFMAVRVGHDLMLKYFRDKYMSIDRYTREINDMDNIDGLFTLDHMQDIYGQKDIVDLLKVWLHKDNFEHVVASFSQTPFGTMEIKTQESESMKQLAQQELERIEKYKNVLTEILS